MRSFTVFGLAAALALALAGCAGLPGLRPSPRAGADAPARPAARPAMRPGASASGMPLSGARTAAALDTTTATERQAALAPPPAPGERRLGTTVASLGAAADPGFWIATPLVSTPAKGRVSAGAASVAVDLRPTPGPKGGGSQLSLAAFRALGLSLTALAEVTVYAE